MRKIIQKSGLFLGCMMLSTPVISVDRSIFNQIKKDHYITRGPNGSYIDWTAGYMSASSTVRLPRIIFNPDHPDYQKPDTALSLTEARSSSRSLAIEQAELRLMNLILSMQLDSEKKIRDEMEEDVSFRDRMGYMSSKFIIKSERLGNGIVSIEMAVPFAGEDGLYSVITDSDYNSEMIPEFPDSVIRQNISGIIIDVSEFQNFKPSLEPRIFTDQGRLIYGPETLNPRIAVKRGLVSFHKNHDKAVSDYRSGLNPYYLHAKSVQNGNVYLDSEEIKRILTSPSGRSAMQAGKIVLVLPE